MNKSPVNKRWIMYTSPEEASSTELFEVEAKMIINPVYLPQFQPGRIVRVKFDPKDRSRVAVE